MQRLVPAILDAWRRAERDLDAVHPLTDEAARLLERLHVLQQAHALATEAGAERAAIVRFLQEHGMRDVVDAMPTDQRRDLASPGDRGFEESDRASDE